MALDYPNAPTVGQVFGKWTWSGSAWVLTPVPTTLTVTWYQEATPPTSGANGETWYQPSTNTLSVLEAGAWTPVTSASTGGFTFITDTAPTPLKAGDTWFDTSTAASGGTSWVAVSEVPGSAGPLNWVQFAPGTITPPVYSYHRRRVDPAALPAVAPNTEVVVGYGLVVKQIGTPLLNGTVFTAPVDGVYALSAWVSFGPGVLSIGLALRRNPQTGIAWNLAGTSAEGAANGYSTAGVSTTDWFAAGEQVFVSTIVEGAGYNWNLSEGYCPSFSAAHLR